MKVDVMIDVVLVDALGDDWKVMRYTSDTDNRCCCCKLELAF